MNEVERIADQLQRAVEGNAWHGPGLLEVIDGMPENESAMPAPGAHTIREIVLHIATWISAARRRLQGSTALLTADEDWPLMGGARWDEVLSHFRQEYQNLLSTVRALREDDLNAFITGQSYSVYFLLHGVIQHVLYHAGQVAIIRGAHRTPDASRAMLRHTLATLAYRGAKTLRNAGEDVADFQVSTNSRTARQILAHLGDLLDWALVMAQGGTGFHESEPLAWIPEQDRFFCSLRKFDDFLASNAILHVPAGKLFQGPIADALTHVGQIAMIRRIAQMPIRGENYYLADIAAGRVGPEQAAPRKEFD